MNKPEIKEKLRKIRFGKSYEELFGEERAKIYKNNLSRAIKNSNKYKEAIKNRDTSGKNNSMYGKSLINVWTEKYGLEEALKREINRIEKRKNTIKNKKINND